MEKKTIEVYKHPYMWKVEVTYGTLQQMVDNRCGFKYSDCFHVVIGGSFNEKMNEISGRRASLIELGVGLEAEKCDYNSELRKLIIYGVKSAKGICYSPWGGTYYYESWFDDMLREGLYPVKADWDGKTYIVSWRDMGKDNNGVPIAAERFYKLTDGFVY